MFLEAVLKYSPEHYELFLAAIHTGMRFGELAGLEWDDIELKGRYLMVKRQLVWGRIQTTKGGKSRRVDLSTPLAEALKALKRKRHEEYLAKGENENPKPEDQNRAGNPRDKDNERGRHLHKSLKTAGLRKIRFHDVRYTTASLLIQNGENLAYVKEQLGHSSIKLTVDVYGHLVPGANREALDRLPLVSPL